MILGKDIHDPKGFEELCAEQVWCDSSDPYHDKPFGMDRDLHLHSLKAHKKTQNGKNQSNPDNPHNIIRLWQPAGRAKRRRKI